MRLIRFLLCVVVLLIMGGCSHHTQGDSASESSGPRGSMETQKLEDTATSTSSKEKHTASTAEQETAFPGFAESYALKIPPEEFNQGFTAKNTVETPDGLYHIGPHSLLYFCPRGESFFVPLCGKPNCQHKTEDCNAYTDGLALGYYNGGLYTINYDIGDGFPIVKRNLDGTDHRIVATVNLDDCETGGSTLLYDFSFDCGKLYIFVQGGLEHLVVVDLKDGSQREIGKSFFRERQIGCNLPIYHNGKLYVLTEENKLNAAPGAKLVEFDLENETWRELVEGVVDFYVTDSTLYYLELDQTRWGGEAVADPGFREMDLKTGEVTDFGMPLEDENVTGGFYDGKYVYAYCTHTGVLYILSLEQYMLVDRLDLPAGSCFPAVSQDRLYICEPGAENSISHYLDKSQIGSHQLTLTEVEMMVPDIPDVQTFDVYD